MIIKKFQAASETEAILAAKEELGKDAIVMNIKTIKPKGIYKLFKKPVVEVTAAIDEESEEKNTIKQQKQNIQNETKPSLSASIIPEESAIEKKLNTYLQDLLEKQMTVVKEEKVSEKPEEKEEKPEQEDKRMACIQLIYNQLVQNEVDENYANQIINEIESSLKKEATLDNTLAVIYQKIILKLGQTAIIDIEKDKTKFIFFIGPTGVGKTTTIAKLASNLKLNQKGKIALMTADTYRIAAVEQLRTYADILGIPLKVVYSAEEIKEAKKEFQDFDLVLVDTAGHSHKNKEQCKDLELLIQAIPKEEREVYLVLSSTTKYKDLIKIVETYQPITEFRLIFTKLDETSSVGNIFNLRMMTGAPLSYYTNGQNVPDDIYKIDAQSIAKQLLGGSQ